MPVDMAKQTRGPRESASVAITASQLGAEPPYWGAPDSDGGTLGARGDRREEAIPFPRWNQCTMPNWQAHQPPVAQGPQERPRP